MGRQHGDWDMQPSRGRGEVRLKCDHLHLGRALTEFPQKTMSTVMAAMLLRRLNLNSLGGKISKRRHANDLWLLSAADSSDGNHISKGGYCPRACTQFSGLAAWNAGEIGPVVFGGAQAF